MKNALLVALILALTGCASDRILYDDDLRPLSREEVSQAIVDCEAVNQRAVLSQVRAKWKTTYVMVTVAVSCAPGVKVQQRW